MTGEDRIAVVTGAARGLGRALSEEFARRGVQVAAVGRSRESMEPLNGTPGIHPFVADIADHEAVARVFAEIDSSLGAPTILMNNAAVYPHRDILDETPQSFGETMAINLGGMFAATHSALVYMIPRGTGRIVNVTTFADRHPAPLSAAYSVSKGAGKILTRALNADLADRFPDIVISDWVPGALKTDMGIPDGIAPEEAARWGVDLALMVDRSLNGALFDKSVEVLAPRGRGKRLVDLLLGRRVAPRRLEP